MRDGLFPGHTLSTILFYLGLRRALRRFAANFDPSVADSVHVEYVDDLVLQFLPNFCHLVMLVLIDDLKFINLRLNHVKSKMLIPSAAEGEEHPSIRESGLPQVFGQMPLLG